MAAVTEVQQTIIFRTASNIFDESAIWNNSLIQSLLGNCLGNDAITEYKHYRNLVAGVYTDNTAYFVTVFFAPAFLATFLSNIPTLISQLPQFTINTYGENVSFGF